MTQHLSPCFLDPSFSSSCSRLVKAPAPRGIQRLLTAEMENLLDDDFRSRASRADTARLKSARAPSSGAWIMAIPSEPLLTLSPSAYSLATRHRLGLHPSDYMPSRCACGADPRLSHSHAHACPKIRRRAANVRHGLIEQCIEFCGSEAGCLILTEDHTRRSEWPDQRIFFPPDPAWFSTGLVLSDVSVACPTAPSHIPNAQVVVGNVADIRARSKSDKYRAMAQELGAMVIPFTLETYGALGKSASDLLKRLVDAYSLLPNAPLSPAAFSVLIRQRVSVALQKGNALVDTQGIRLAVTASCRLSAPSSL